MVSIDFDCIYLVSSELFNSYKANLEEMFSISKHSISSPIADNQVRSFMGSQFRSAFTKYCKRDRSPSGSRSESKSKSRVTKVQTARPPVGYRRESTRDVAREHVRESTPTRRQKAKTNDLDARLKQMEDWQRAGVDGNDDSDGQPSEPEAADQDEDEDLLG